MRRVGVVSLAACSLAAASCVRYLGAGDDHHHPDVSVASDARHVDASGREARVDVAAIDGIRAEAAKLDVKKPDAVQNDVKKMDAVQKPDGGGCIHPAVVESCDASNWCTIPAGCFTMGSPSTEPCRTTNETQHQVTLTHAFVISRMEITQAQFQAVMSYNPSSYVCSDCPVENVTWHQAAAYCNAVSTAQGLAACYSCTGTGTGVSCAVASVYQNAIYACKGYRLPTEAEHEYATRAGTATALYDGPLSQCFGKSDVNADAIGWYKDNSQNKIHLVGQLAKNGWGLRDMAGNVWEWTNDGYIADLGSTSVVDPSMSAGAQRVIRGGSFFDNAAYMRSASRYQFAPSSAQPTQGFRCARSLP